MTFITAIQENQGEMLDAVEAAMAYKTYIGRFMFDAAGLKGFDAYTFQ